MRWQLAYAALVLVLLVLGAPGLRARAATPPAPDQALIERVRTEGHARVLVQLEVPLRPEALTFDAQDDAQQRAAIQQAQDAVLSRLTTVASAAPRRLRYVPVLALDVDLAMLEALRHDPQVHRIAEDTLLLPQLDQSGPLIGAPATWEQGFSGAGWAVAVLDTGVDSSHPFLGANVIDEACFSTIFPPQHITSLCPNAQASDYGAGTGANCTSTAADGSTMVHCGHGTHIAGIVAGSGDTFSGIAPEASVIAIQVFSKQQQSDGTSRIVAYSSDVLAALEHVYELRNTHRIAAVNLSLATSAAYRSTEECKDYSAYGAAFSLVEQLRDAGIATIAAAGNGAHTDGINAPACLSNVISVGATTSTDEVWSTSNSAAFVDLLAPGANIRSAFPVEGFPAFDTFVRFSGTSQAAAQVSGAWAVLKEAVPEASVSQIADALRTSGQPIRDLRNGVELPRIQLDAALIALRATIRQAPPAAPFNLRATNERPSGMRLAWHDGSANETGFVIERSTDSLNWQEHTHLPPNSTSYLDTRLSCATRYSYRVRALNASATASATSEPSNTASITSDACAPGDCNHDMRLDAGDLAALNSALAAPASSSQSCDANQDDQISSADITCTLRRVFGISCTNTRAFASATAAAPDNPATGATTRSGMPTLVLPLHLATRANQTITVPLTFRAGAEPVSSVAFAIQYDHERLRFDSAIPHAISFDTLPTGFQGYSAFDNAHEEGTIDIAILASTPAEALPDGTTLAVLTFAIRNTDIDTTTPLDFAAIPGTSFGTPAGSSSPGSSSPGSIQISAATQPALSIPAQVRAMTEGSGESLVSVAVMLAPNGTAVAQASFCMRYNATWLTPAPPDDLLRLPAGVRGRLISSGPAQMCMAIEAEDAAPFAAGELGHVRFRIHETLPQGGDILISLDAEQPVSFTDPAGQPYVGEIGGGSLPGVRVLPAPHTLYLPVVRTS